jgi:hypothetical protein
MTTSTHPRRHWRRNLLLAVALLVVLLIALRAALPGWVTRAVNERMADMGDYQGQVADVDLRLIIGAYSVRDIVITKVDGDAPVPFFAAPRIDLSVSWRALFKGRLVATSDIHEPQVNFVDIEGEDNQTGAGVDWRAQLEELAPFRLNEVRVHDGEIWFRNFISRPQVDLQATNVQGRVLNLSNVEDRERARAASFQLTADVLGQAPLESSAEFNPFDLLENFDFRLRVTQIDLTRLNEFLQAYAKLDAEGGTGDFVMELACRQGELTGYAKPLFDEVEIFSWKEDVEEEGDNPLRALWEAIAGGIENLFKNQELDQIATRVEITGTVEDADTSVGQAIVAILVNAFVEAYRPVFEGLPEQEEDACVGSDHRKLMIYSEFLQKPAPFRALEVHFDQQIDALCTHAISARLSMCDCRIKYRL